MDPVLLTRGLRPAVQLLRLTRHLPPVRRILLGRRLRTLEPGNTIGTFCDVLGYPRASRRSEAYTVHTWSLPDVAATAITPADDVTILAYQIERVAKRFTPKIDLVPKGNVPTLRLHLGRTTFADAQLAPVAVQACLGASSWTYKELHYLGRPGGYRHYTIGAGSRFGSEALLNHLRRQLPDQPRDPTSDPTWDAARTHTAVNSYAVYDATLDMSRWPSEPALWTTVQEADTASLPSLP